MLEEAERNKEAAEKAQTRNSRKNYNGEGAASVQETIKEEGAKVKAIKNILDYKRMADYDSVEKNDDFEELSRYNTTQFAKTEREKQAENKTPYDESVFREAPAEAQIENVYGDLLYEYINKNPDAVKYLEHTEAGKQLFGTESNYLKEMTDEEVKKYNYLYAKDHLTEWFK